MFGRKFPLIDILFSVSLFRVFSLINAKKFQERIIGGEDSHISEVPWQVQLIITKNDTGFICGGSWISPGGSDGMMDFVLTAAHCVDKVKSKPHFLAVRAGGSNILAGNIFEATAIALHPRYKSASGGYDIALINLVHPVEITPGRAEPVTLPDGPAPDKQACKISGFGYLYLRGGPSWILQKVDLPIIDTQECWTKWRNHGAIEQRTGFCSYNNVSNSCSGDSGGPLVCLHSQDGRFYQHGVASFMTPHCTHGFFTNVSMFKDWIMETADEMRSRRARTAPPPPPRLPEQRRTLFSRVLPRFQQLQQKQQLNQQQIQWDRERQQQQQNEHQRRLMQQQHWHHQQLLKRRRAPQRPSFPQYQSPSYAVNSRNQARQYRPPYQSD